MCFEDEFMDKQSEIISLYKEAASAKSELLYVYIYNDDSRVYPTKSIIRSIIL